MPIALVDPSVAPVGAGIPQSPLSAMFGQAVGAYGQTFPSAMDRAKMTLEQTQAQQIQQQMGSGSGLAGTVQHILSMQHPQTVQQPATAANTPVGPVPAPSMGVTTPVQQPGASTGDAMRAGLPDLIRYAAESGDVGKANNLSQLITAFLPGTPGDISGQQKGVPSTMDLAMLGAGHGVAETPGAMAMGATPEQRALEGKIQTMMSTGMSRRDATLIATGAVEGGINPMNSQPYVVDKAALMHGGSQSPPASGGATGPRTVQPNVPLSQSAGQDTGDYVSDLAGAQNNVMPNTIPGTTPGSPAAPAVDLTQFTPQNLKFDLNDAFGVGNSLDRIVSGNGGKAGDTLSQLNGLKGAMVDIDSALREGRNTKFAQELSADQLPFSEKDITDIHDITKTGWQDGDQGNKDIARKFTTYASIRQGLAEDINDTSLPVDQRKADVKIAKMIDRMMSNYAQGSQFDNYAQTYGLKTSKPAAIPQPSNLAAGAAHVAAPDSRVKVYNPNGTPGTVSAIHLKELLAAGGKVRE